MLFPSFKEANGDSRSLNPENFIEMEQGMSSSPINVADGCCHRQAVAAYSSNGGCMERR